MAKFGDQIKEVPQKKELSEWEKKRIEEYERMKRLAKLRNFSRR